jgi:hypothetical protein
MKTTLNKLIRTIKEVWGGDVDVEVVKKDLKNNNETTIIDIEKGYIDFKLIKYNDDDIEIEITETDDETIKENLKLFM